MTSVFEEEYKKLNKAQKEAVDSIEGPVMVVAGPGTGKTQILALRIGNILLKTDIKPDGILCLTFTNSGVRAMRSRLKAYIGADAGCVQVSTFHSFGLELIEKHFELLGFIIQPKLLDDGEAVFLLDEILRENEWEHLRPRVNPEMYFNDLKQLISVLKRERLSPDEFLFFVESDIENLKNDENNISLRGESKGKLKKEVEKKIESLERTREVVQFYRIYEEKKRESGFMDYDDILEYAVKLAEEYEDIRADIRENYQYVLVDEHQDSSGVQNSFLKAVWKDVDMPNIFVVGDDRQLIYAFSGAKLSYFEEFSHIFGKAKLVVLTENYRSTSPILSLADDLLKSSMTGDKLRSNISLNKQTEQKISLSEYGYPRDEIIGAGLYFKKKISEGVPAKECALLVPKNYHVRNAIQILRNLGVPVSAGGSLSLFELPETQSFMRVLQIISDPFDAVALSESVLDKYSGINPLTAHKFLKFGKPERMTIEELSSHGNGDGLFAGEDDVSKWGNKLKNWVNTLSSEKLSVIMSVIGNELLIDEAKEHEDLIRNVEVVRSFLHLALLFEERRPNRSVAEFLKYLKRLESYSSHVGLATFGGSAGVQVMTLHKSKGLEYKAVWIAHMNEEVIMSEKKNSFSLPEKVKMHVREKDVESSKRELYVAITRAKEFCNISYANSTYRRGEMELAHIIRDLPEAHFDTKNKDETEKEILAKGPKFYTPTPIKDDSGALALVRGLVKENYSDVKVSVTMLNNFFECPWKWYFRNFLKLPETKSKSLALGSAVHKTIEFILKSKSDPSVALIKEKITSELQKEGIDSSPQLKKLIKDGEAAVKLFIDGFYDNLAKDYVTERSLSFRDSKFSNLLMHGKIDLTERSDSGDVVITDFKTGSSKTKSVIEKLDEENRLSSHLRQLAMYSYLVAGAEKGKKVSESRLLYLESSKEDKNMLYSTRISEDQINLLVKDITDYDNLLNSGEWVNRPCNYNSYGKGTMCEYCKMAEIYSL